MDSAGLLAALPGIFFVYKEVEIIETEARAQRSADVKNSLFALEKIALGQEITSTFTKANERPENLIATERWQPNLFLSQMLELYARECYYVEIGTFRECESVPRATAAASELRQVRYAWSLGSNWNTKGANREISSCNFCHLGD